ncbi:MAG: hypothetical protein WCF79_23665, partial [Rhodomicrobium sp.]
SMNWHHPCAYNPDFKETFHRTARARLRTLATLMGWNKDSFDLRNNRAGIAVSGEITLHYDAVYIQVSQPATGHDSGILIRRCNGLKDYTGERNHFASLSLLDDLPALAGRVNAVLGSEVHP